VFLNAPEGSEIFYSRESVFFLSVSSLDSEGKTDEGKEFIIAEGTVSVCLLHFRLEDLRK